MTRLALGLGVGDARCRTRRGPEPGAVASADLLSRVCSFLLPNTGTIFLVGKGVVSLRTRDEEQGTHTHTRETRPVRAVPLPATHSTSPRVG